MLKKIILIVVLQLSQLMAMEPKEPLSLLNLCKEKVSNLLAQDLIEGANVISDIDKLPAGIQDIIVELICNLNIMPSIFSKPAINIFKNKPCDQYLYPIGKSKYSNFVIRQVNFVNAVVYDRLTARVIHTLIGHNSHVQSGIVSPDEKLIITGSGSPENVAKVWDMQIGQCIRTFKRHIGCIVSIAISNDNQFLVTGSFDETVKVWDIKSGKCVSTFKSDGTTAKVAISDDNTLVAASGHKHVKVWDLTTNQLISATDTTNFVHSALAISHDNSFIAVSSELGDNTIVYDIKTRERLYTLKGHTDSITCIEISPDNSFIVTGSRDKTVRIWDSKTGKCLCILSGHTGLIDSISISEDSRYVTSGSWDRTTRVWEVPLISQGPGRLINQIKNILKQKRDNANCIATDCIVS